MRVHDDDDVVMCEVCICLCVLAEGPEKKYVMADDASSLSLLGTRRRISSARNRRVCTDYKKKAHVRGARAH